MHNTLYSAASNISSTLTNFSNKISEASHLFYSRTVNWMPEKLQGNSQATNKIVGNCISARSETPSQVTKNHKQKGFFSLYIASVKPLNNFFFKKDLHASLIARSQVNKKLNDYFDTKI